MTDFNKLMTVIALLCIGAVIAFGLLFFFVPIPEANKDLVNIVVMAIVGFGGSIIGFFFGSSKGSAEKNQLLKPQ